MKRLLFVCVLVALSGCFSSGVKLVDLVGDGKRMLPEHALSIETAGVIAFVEPQPRIHFVASSLMDSNLKPANLSDWNAAAEITALVEERLQRKGFKVVKIDPQMSVAEAYPSSASFAAPERIRSRLLEIGRAHNVDMLVVIYRQQVRDFMTKSSQKVISYGLLKRHSDDQVYAYSVVHFEALNIDKGYTLAEADAKVKAKLPASAWQAKFESGDGPFRISAARDDVIGALKNAVLIAGQEAGVTN
jgi:hypothetical protein